MELNDNYPESNIRIIAFSSEIVLRRLATADTIYADDNFVMAPNKYQDVCVLRIPFDDVVIQCGMFALLLEPYRLR